ncbi:putative cytochrome P450 E-class, group IV [Podospora fimiseda]|uniref:Cytochrome P450 E-class, group IV n=1 Tax=Podospora fimiseda TaxID=252190 RepID=A0AAN7BL38_9PEZI|nr:putative cytochrome P450 E-class, group IV [Podospora fimiseda]
MPVASLSATVFSLILALFLVNIIHRYQRWRRLANIPGSPLAGWTSLWLTRRFVGFRVFEDIRALSNKYGPLVRIAPNTIVCTDVDTLYRISEARTMYKKSKWYEYMTRIVPGSDNILSVCDPEARKQRLKQVIPGYTYKPSTTPDNPSSFEAGTHRALTSFINLIDSKYLSNAQSSTLMDFSEKCFFYTLDAFGEMAYSESFGSLQNDDDVLGIKRTGDGHLVLLLSFHCYPQVMTWLRRWPLVFLLPRVEENVGFGAVIGHARKLVEERMEPKGKEKQDLLQSFIDHGLKGDELVHEVAMSFFAASDTVASSLRITMLLLLTHPSIYFKLQNELDSACITSDGLLTAAQAKSFKYLQYVIKESLRLFPSSATLPFSKEVPEGGDTICGFHVPAGTNISTGSVVYAIGRDAQTWGDDADILRPERWDEKDEEKLNKMNRAWNFIFGGGKFVCVGKGIALMELGVVVGELIRRYDWSLPNILEMPKVENNTTWEAHDMFVRIEKRKVKETH